MSKGASIKVTRLTDNFGFQDYRKALSSTAVLLVAIDDRNNLKVFTDRKPVEPQSGWIVMALVEKSEKGEKTEKVEKAEKGDDAETVDFNTDTGV